MNLNALRIFQKTMHCASRSDAASALGLSPSAVTKALHRLEEEIGCDLFQSDAQGHHPTYLANAILPLVNQLFLCEEALEDCVARYLGHSEDSVTVQCSESFGAYHFPQAMIYFASRHPEYQIECTLCHNEEALRNTLTLNNDLSIV